MTWTFKIWTAIEAYNEETDTHQDIEGYTVSLGQASSLRDILEMLRVLVQTSEDPNPIVLDDIDEWIERDADGVMEALETKALKIMP